jgi:hypothetical protein
MTPHDPPDADDASGVLLEFCVDGEYVQVQLARPVLSAAYGVMASRADRVATYLVLRTAIKAAVARCLRSGEREMASVQITVLAHECGPLLDAGN